MASNQPTCSREIVSSDQDSSFPFFVGVPVFSEAMIITPF